MSKVKMSQISNCALYGILEGTGEEINEFIQTHRQHDNVHLTFSVIAFDEQIKGYRAYFIFEIDNPKTSSEEMSGYGSF
jgi:hypothetical protein